MKKLTLTPGKEHSFDDLNGDYSIDRTGFPASSNFTKKSQGAILSGGGVTKKLVLKKNKICWRKISTENVKPQSGQVGGGTKQSKSSKSTQDMVKMMMVQRLLKRRDEEEQVGGSVTNPALVPEVGIAIMDLKTQLPIATWQEIPDRDLNAFTLLYQVTKDFKEVSIDLCKKLTTTMEVEIIPLTRDIRADVVRNSRGFKDTTRRADFDRVKLFADKFQRLTGVCNGESMGNDGTRVGRLFEEVQRSLVELTKIQHQNDFKNNVVKLQTYDGKNLTDIEMHDIIAANEDLAAQLPSDYLGARIINDFTLAVAKAKETRVTTRTQEQLAQEPAVTTTYTPVQMETLSGPVIPVGGTTTVARVVTVPPGTIVVGGGPQPQYNRPAYTGSYGSRKAGEQMRGW